MLVVLSIIPAGLRPLVKLEQNTLVISGINELYKVIITKNNRIRKLKQIRTKATISLEVLERYNLQKAVNLILGTTKNSDKKSILRLSSAYFKQYLLGRRVNFSGRSVIASGPTLTYLQIGIPFKLGVKLFEYHLLKIIQKSKVLKTLLSLSSYLKTNILFFKRLLNFILHDQIVLINRAPTLHRMNIQAFKPYLVEGHAIKLFPLVCSGFNADFDGDQMGAFVLSSVSSRKEIKYHGLTDKNMLHPYSFKNIFKYSQGIILGLNTLLALKYKEKNQFVFSSIPDLLNSYFHGLVNLNTVILLRTGMNNTISNKTIRKYILTSVGKLFLRLII